MEIAALLGYNGKKVVFVVVRRWIMGAKNKVVAGDYLNKMVMGGKIANPSISLSLTKILNLDKKTVESYEIITEETRKSATSGIVRGAVGSVLLGPVGLLAGLSAKNKGTYNIAIKFKDGKNSLLEVDDKIYNAIIRVLF